MTLMETDDLAGPPTQVWLHLWAFEEGYKEHLFDQSALNSDFENCWTETFTMS